MSYWLVFCLETFAMAYIKEKTNLHDPFLASRMVITDAENDIHILYLTVFKPLVRFRNKSRACQLLPNNPY